MYEHVSVNVENAVTNSITYKTIWPVLNKNYKDYEYRVPTTYEWEASATKLQL